jgi:hypothetical protein
MFGKLAKTIAYVRAPRATFVLRHPVKAVKAYRLRRKLMKVTGPRIALGAAVLAVPVGIAVARHRLAAR